MAASASIAADPPADHADAVDHGGVESVPTHVSGQPVSSPSIPCAHHVAQGADVDLVHDPGAGRHADLEVGEGSRPHAEPRYSRLRSYSTSMFRSNASGVRMSAMTQWSMTISAGASGLIFEASPP